MKKIQDISIALVDGVSRAECFILFAVGQEIPVGEPELKKSDVVVKITVLFGVIRVYFGSGMITKYKGFKYIYTKK